MTGRSVRGGPGSPDDRHHDEVRGNGSHEARRAAQREAAGDSPGDERAPVHDEYRTIHQVRADGRIIGEFRFDTPIFLISVAAELAGMHAQTLRSYDREGLVRPRRTSGGGRRYSQRDIELLQQVQQLSQDEGVNRAGIRRIIELEGEVDALRGKIEELLAELSGLRSDLGMDPAEETAAGDAPQADDEPRTGDRGGATEAVVAVRRDVVPWRSRTTTVVTWRSAGR